MTATVRYKQVVNTTGAVLVSDAISDRDGDDKQYKVVKRTLAAIDIGTTPGKTRDADGVLACKIDKNTNILSVQGSTYRNGRLIDNLILPDAAAANIVQASIRYAIFNDDDDPVKEIRVIDTGAVGAVQLAVGDVIFLVIVIGTAPDS